MAKTKRIGGWGPVFLTWLDANFKEPSLILEFGSGHGTNAFLDRGHEVHSVEHNPQWIGIAKGANYHYAPIKGGWYDPKILKALPQDPDLLIIDGPPGTIGRNGILRHFHILEGAKMILVDDVNRTPEQKILQAIVRKMKLPYTSYHDHGKSFAIIDRRSTCKNFKNKL